MSALDAGSLARAALETVRAASVQARLIAADEVLEQLRGAWFRGGPRQADGGRSVPAGGRHPVGTARHRVLRRFVRPRRVPRPGPAQPHLRPHPGPPGRSPGPRGRGSPDQLPGLPPARAPGTLRGTALRPGPARPPGRPARHGRQSALPGHHLHHHLHRGGVPVFLPPPRPGLRDLPGRTGRDPDHEPVTGPGPDHQPHGAPRTGNTP